MARQTPKTRASGKAGRSLRQKVLKGEAVDKEALRLPCLEARRLYAAPIKGDGNCLFYSLSDQLYGCPDHHEEIRTRLVDHIRMKSEYFMQFVTDVGGERRAPRRAAAEQAKRSSGGVGRMATKDGQRAKFEEMLSQMGRTGVWGGSVEIQAFCQAYEKDVNVYTENGIQSFTSDLSQTGQKREVMHVAYHSFEHYSSVRSVDGPHTGLPNLSGRSGQDPEMVNWEKDSQQTSDDASSSSPPPTSLTLAEPWKISTIAEALPGLDHETIRAVLTKCRGDIDNAFSRLLDDDSCPSSQSSVPSSSAPARATPDIARPVSASLNPSTRPCLGSSSRSSSRHSSGSKRSADYSDDEEGSIRPATRRRRGRDLKRRVLQNVTVGISVQGDDEDDVFSIIRLRVNPDAVVQQAEVTPNACEEERDEAESPAAEDSDSGSEGTLASCTHDGKSECSKTEHDSGYGDSQA